MIDNDPAHWDLSAVNDALQAAGLYTGGNVAALGVGYHSLAVTTAANDVVRLGRNPGVVVRHKLETLLLPKLDGRLSVAVPRPQWLSAPSDVLPFGAIAYPMISGEIMSGPGTKSLARQIASFLVELHEITDVGNVHLPGVAQRRQALEELRLVVTEAVAPIDRSAACQIDHWFGHYDNDEEVWDFAPCLVHHDAAEDNLLLRDDELIAVIDWEHAAWSDPAIDFSAQQHTGPGFMDWVMDAYQALGGSLDGNERRRIERGTPIGPMHTITLGYRTGNQSLIRRKLEELTDLGVVGPR